MRLSTFRIASGFAAFNLTGCSARAQGLEPDAGHLSASPRGTLRLGRLAALLKPLHASLPDTTRSDQPVKPSPA
ncbi:MAG: hypothetical protein EPN36_07870 [Rhodanobacteraceae bacterium]|nr:MAG: hypothetical protein EPN36_07870 [Rhodanobacteraceae bacterium]